MEYVAINHAALDAVLQDGPMYVQYDSDVELTQKEGMCFLSESKECVRFWSQFPASLIKTEL